MTLEEKNRLIAFLTTLTSLVSENLAGAIEECLAIIYREQPREKMRGALGSGERPCTMEFHDENGVEIVDLYPKRFESLSQASEPKDSSEVPQKVVDTTTDS